MQTDEKLYFHKLISLKNKGGLRFPSKDLFDICVTCEAVVRKLLNENIAITAENQHQTIVLNILKKFIGNNQIFINLESKHEYVGQEHKLNLIRCVIEKYLNIRFHHIAKLESISKSVQSKRQAYKKIIQHKGF